MIQNMQQGKRSKFIVTIYYYLLSLSKFIEIVYLSICKDEFYDMMYFTEDGLSPRNIYCYRLSNKYWITPVHLTIMFISCTLRFVLET